MGSTGKVELSCEGILTPRVAMFHRPAKATSQEPRLWQATDTWVCGYDLAAAKLRWVTAFGGFHFPSQHNLRAIRLALRYRPRFYASFNLLVHLFPEQDGALSVLAFDATDGKLRWRSAIAIPPPASFTEMRTEPEDLETEELRALFVQRDDAITIAIARHSRTAESWLGDGRHFPPPPWGAQIDLHELDARTGVSARKCTLMDATIRYYELERFDGLHIAGGVLFDFDWARFSARRLIEISGESPSIGFHGERVYVSSICDGGVQISACDRHGALREHRGMIRQKSTRRAAIHHDGRGCSLVWNETKVFPMSEAGTPIAELNVKHYIYQVLRTDEATLFVYCSGNGSNLYCFDVADPSPKFHIKKYAGDEIRQRGPDGEVIAVEPGSILRFARDGTKLKPWRCNIDKQWFLGAKYVCGTLTKRIADGDYESAVFELP